MSEQDNADVIEQAPRRFSFAAVAPHGAIGTGRRRLAVIAAACALLVTAATLVTLRLTEGPGANPALAKLISEVTTVPVGQPVSGSPASAAPPSAYASTRVAAGVLAGDPQRATTESQMCFPPVSVGS